VTGPARSADPENGDHNPEEGGSDYVTWMVWGAGGPAPGRPLMYPARPLIGSSPPASAHHERSVAGRGRPAPRDQGPGENASGAPALAAADEAGEARQLLGRLLAVEEAGYLDPFAMAVAHAAFGEAETAAGPPKSLLTPRIPATCF
jgi:hypothetical protein